jgi:hypothetical protein
MNPDSTFLLQAPDQLARVQGGILGEQAFQVVDDLLGELVRSLGSWSLRQQRRQTALFEEGSGLVEARSGEAEICRRPGCLSTFLMDAAQHLVLDLDQVARVEEGIAGLEGSIANVPRSGVESVVPAQSLELVLFWILPGQGAPPPE